MKKYTEKLESMESGKDKEILKAIGSDLKPYVKKHDGFAKEIKEDIQVKYKDYDSHENTLTIPAGSIVKVMDYSCEIVTKEDFDEGYVFHDEGDEGDKGGDGDKAEDTEEKEKEEKEEPKKKKKYGPLGMESLNS